MEALSLLAKVYELTKSFPYSERDLADQIKRAAKSISANIAEGFAKRLSPKEFKRFLSISLGSSDEVVAHLRTIYLLMPPLREPSKKLGEEYKILSRRLNVLRTKW